MTETMIPHACRVVARRREAKDVVTLKLDLEEGGVGNGVPGQFNMLYAFGVGEVPVSVSGCAGSGWTIAHTIRSVGPVSAALCTLKVGDVVGVRGPYGNAWPLDLAEKNDVLLVAGGLGMAPLRPVVEHLLSRREAYGRIALLYGSRSPETLIFEDDLKGWSERGDLEFAVTVDHADQNWDGKVGAITSLIDTPASDLQSTLVLVCGPSLMMRFVVGALEGAGCPARSIFVSMERNMKCAVGQCGRCQYGPHFICRDGAIFRYDEIATLFRISDI